LKQILISTLTVLAFTSAYAADAVTYENSPPSAELRLLKTISSIAEVSVYISGTPENIDSFKQGDTYLYIEQHSDSWWIQTPMPFSEIDALGFVDDANLLVGLRSATGTATSVLNLNSRELYSIGQGEGELILDGPHEGFIRLNGQYGFDVDGRYWYTSIVDLNGRVVEFGTEGSSCLPISQIISSGIDTTVLRQSMDFCVGVER